MLKNMAVKYYKMGYNCSQSIIMAVNEKYNINISMQCVEMCEGISNGLGIGSVCSVLVACIMIISFIYPMDIKSKRLEMIERFNKINGGINCSKIKSNNCIKIIENSCDILEDMINGYSIKDKKT